MQPGNLKCPEREMSCCDISDIYEVYKWSASCSELPGRFSKSQAVLASSLSFPYGFSPYTHNIATLPPHVIASFQNGRRRKKSNGGKVCVCVCECVCVCVLILSLLQEKK